MALKQCTVRVRTVCIHGAEVLLASPRSGHKPIGVACETPYRKAMLCLENRDHAQWRRAYATVNITG